MAQQNTASAWVLEGRVHGEEEWGHYFSFTSILIDECNDTPLKTRMGLDNRFDLGKARAESSLSYHRRAFGETQEFRVVLKNDWSPVDEVGVEYVFKGKTRKI
tara:strand:- start:152 stop:460 length:309 start_codon:yes stop_codon:yes gene_type:complete